MSSGLLLHLTIAGILLGSATTAQEPAPLLEGNAYVRSVLRDPRSQDGAINDYSYDMVEMKEDLDKKGGATSREIWAYQVYFVDKRPVRRLVAKDGVPLSPKEQAEVDRKAEDKAKAIAGGRTVNERPGIRLSSLVDSFEFQTVGREMRDGRATLVFDFKPRENAAPTASSNRTTNAVAKILMGRMYVDEADKRVVRLDARNTPGEKASVAAGVKVGAFELVMEFTSVQDGVWLPKRVMTLATGRAFFFKTFRIRRTTVYWNYRRFSVATDEKPMS
ncbi:MAG: hypothetical protein JJE39_10175 [Vicinamibacteria bacterium]|nr:hypothetical protein [Vicinamibacteria bacterium]